ncbi:RNA pyrophosphohydrolase [Lactococcus nasutitermitis]|uniref:RNA pyrophosphohydrolase n=1 Tax=Lactococcus nasutitermitis TaxID=1652957 RepID=A0ABV9JD46_9LACT|nr:RNA pyrophosphohydrolase [Lactococcus nasutitermitis]
MKEYRKNVAAIIINDEGKTWLGEREDHLAWGFPQGGIEKGETAEEALKRELMEELATNDFEIIDKYPGTLKYDFPAGMTFPTWTYVGQEQQYFLIKLHLTAYIDLEKYDHEFIQYKFVDLDELLQMDFSFKTEVYRKALDYFKTEIVKKIK